jgi:hypothetical protein
LRHKKKRLRYLLPAVRISCLAYTTRPPPQLNGPRFLRSSPQIAYLVRKAPPLRAVEVIMIKMELLTRQHRQPATAARLAVRLSQQSFTHLLMLAAVPRRSGVHPATTAPRHDTPPSRRLIPHRHNRRDGHTLVDLDHPRKQRRTPTQLRTRLTRHLHNLKTRRRTLRAIDARPTRVTLNIERLPTDLAISLRLHALSLLIVAPPVPTSGRENFWGAGPEASPH